MLKIYQQTINEPIKFEGIGLHTGTKTKLKILPGKEDEGIIFKRVDLADKDKNVVKASYDKVSDARLCTTLENKFGIRVSTVEHLLAALYISEIDNAVIEINNEEVPIMDGSAKDFLKALLKTETVKQNKKRKYLKVLNKVSLIDREKKISIEPSDFFEVSFQLNYNNKIIGKQKNNINFYTDSLDDVYNSRTFCLFEDIEKIRKLGLAKGGTLENALVVDSNKVLNKEGLRNKKEFVNHKILDLAGDFLLSGYRILGKIECHQGGHELSNKFLRKLMCNTSSYEVLELKDVLVSKKVNVEESTRLAVNA